MRPDPFPRPGEDDDQEPDSSRPDGDIGPEQGLFLFLCLPAENFDPDQFAQSGPAADMAPGPMLGTIIDVAVGEDGSGLAGMSYDQLIGIVAAARRMQSRFAWCELAAMREFAGRAGGQGPRGAFAADELADELNVTWQSAAGQMEYASDVAERLPRTFAALGAGRLDSFRVRIIEEETRILSAEDAAKADAELAEVAGSLTYGKVRSAARAGAEAGPGGGPQAEGSCTPRGVRTPVPRGVRQHRNGRPGAALGGGGPLMAAPGAARPGPARRRRRRHHGGTADPGLPRLASGT